MLNSTLESSFDPKFATAILKIGGHSENIEFELKKRWERDISLFCHSLVVRGIRWMIKMIPASQLCH